MGLFRKKDDDCENDFKPTKKISEMGCSLLVDHDSKQWCVKRFKRSNIHKFSDIINYELIPLAQGAVSKVNGKGNNISTLGTTMGYTIRITVDNRDNPSESLSAISLKIVHDMMAELDFMVKEAQRSEQQQEGNFQNEFFNDAQRKDSEISLGDELLKLRNLYESGAITEQEYKAAKIKILT